VSNGSLLAASRDMRCRQRFQKLKISNNKSKTSIKKVNEMDKKIETSIKTVLKYFRDFSIVVAGIAVTLYVNYQVTNQGEKRDLKLYLNAIKLELEENNKLLNKTIEELQPSLRYTDYLVTHDKKSLDMDTIKSYEDAFYSFHGISCRTNAFEMFKSSGTMRLVENKKLLLDLWDVYDEYASVKETFDIFFPIKWEDIKKEVALILDGQKLKVAPMYNYYYLGMPYQVLTPCERALKKSKELALTLEKELE